MANKQICDFCEQEETKINPVISGDNATICKNCIEAAYNIIQSDYKLENEKLTKNKKSKFPTPEELKKLIDGYVVGQHKAKKVLCVAVYNHYKRIFKNDSSDDTELSKSNVLFIGPTGSGKTLLAQTISKYLDVPLAIADATSLTEAGYVGDDVENVVTRLLNAADGDIKKAEQGIIFIDEIDKIARMSENRSITRDVSGEGVQQALLKIIEGSLVNVPPKGGRKHPGQDLVQIDTSNILFICGGAFDGLEDIIRLRMGANVLGFNHSKKNTLSGELSSFVEPDDLVKYGLIPELVGRLHMTGILNEITLDDMIHILSEPKNALIKQYKKLFTIDDVDLEFDKDALKEVAQLAIKRKTGARGLRSILEESMLDIMFKLPSYKKKTMTITKEVINNKAKPKIA